MQITYKETDSYKGIDGYRFGVTSNAMRPATPDAENDCYCIKQTMGIDGEPSCFLDGALDVYPCFGAPILLSFPHFLYANESYLNGVKGVSRPDSSIHELFLLIEPNTGTPLQGMKRIQLNVVLRPVPYIAYTTGLPSTVIPLVWVEEGVSLTPELIDELNTMYFDVLKVADGVKYAIIAISLATVFISTGFLLRKRYFR
ncbi:hypothetical protein JTB14_014820 [Gonioctena quinquepunctata]|nr:hypothetical protein JTB14_014820 [Gonioctena quinquepunctata]